MLSLVGYVRNADQGKLQSPLQYATGFKSVPPRGLPQKVSVHYLPEDDDERASIYQHLLPVWQFSTFPQYNL